MKSKISALILIFLLLITGCVGLKSKYKTTVMPHDYSLNISRHYDDRGRYVGHSENSNGKIVRHYDSKGRYVGSTSK